MATDEGPKRLVGYWFWKSALRAPWEVPDGCFHFLCQALEQLPNDEAVPEEPSFAFSLRVYDGHTGEDPAPEG